MAVVCWVSRDGTKVFIRRKTPSEGWTRMVIVLLGSGSVAKIVALVEGLKLIFISVRDSLRAKGGVRVSCENRENDTTPDVSISTFTSFEQEGHTSPSIILNVPHGCTEGDASGVIGNVFLVFESGLFTFGRFTVLTNDGVVVLDGQHPVQNPCLRAI